MKILISLILIVVAVGGALAEDTFGLWYQVGDGSYQWWLPAEMSTEPFALYIGLHDPSVFSVGGYEVGIVMPDQVIILQAGGPNGWTNFGDATNHLVGFTTPVPANGDPFTILGTLECLALEEHLDVYISYTGADPPSIPGHDGPVIANGVDPEHLIPCGYVYGSPDVFYIYTPDAVEGRSWSGVKGLFD